MWISHHVNIRPNSLRILPEDLLATMLARGMFSMSGRGKHLRDSKAATSRPHIQELMREETIDTDLTCVCSNHRYACGSIMEYRMSDD